MAQLSHNVLDKHRNKTKQNHNYVDTTHIREDSSIIFQNQNLHVGKKMQQMVIMIFSKYYGYFQQKR